MQEFPEQILQQVNALDITPDKYVIAAAGYQHIRMYDLASNNPNPVINYEGVSKNITSLGFQVWDSYTLQTNFIKDLYKMCVWCLIIFLMHRKKESGCTQEEKTVLQECGISGN